MVPVLRNVDNMNFADIEKGLNELGEKVNFRKCNINECLNESL